MTPSPRSARPLLVGFAVAVLIVAALASPPLAGVWESGRAEAVATGPPPSSTSQPPTSPTQPPTSPPTQPPTSPPTRPPTVPPTSAAPPVTRPRPTTTAPRSSTTDRTEEQAPAQASTTTTTLPQLLVPAENRPDADGEDGQSTSTVSEGSGLAADTKVWLSVALLLVLAVVIGGLTAFYFFHTRPEPDDEADEGLEGADGDGADEGVAVAVDPERQLVGVGAGFASTGRAGDILAGDPPTVPVPVVPPPADRVSPSPKPSPDPLPARPASPARSTAPPVAEPEKPEKPEKSEKSEKPGISDSGDDPGPDDPLGVLTRLLDDPPTGGEAP